MVGGGGWRRSMRGAGAGRAARARGSRMAAAGRAVRHTLSGSVARRSSRADCPHFSPRRAPLLAPPTHAGTRRATTTSTSRTQHMSQVLKSVHPIATARVIPQQISETDQTCTSLRVSTRVFGLYLLARCRVWERWELY